MKKIFRKNQIIITALALMIAVAGYINYSDNIKNKLKNNHKQQETTLSGETDPVSGEILSNDAEPDGSLNDPGAMVFTSNVTSQFIISAKLEREQVRATDKESLLGIINNEEIDNEAKAAAVSRMVELTDASEREAAAELLLEAKGFENVIVSISGSQVDVVVEKEELTQTELAQIEDVVKRKTECSIDNLTITSVSPVKNQSDSPVSGEAGTDDETENGITQADTEQTSGTEETEGQPVAK